METVDERQRESLAEACVKFLPHAVLGLAQQCQGGRIHETYLVELTMPRDREAQTRRYILQKLNTQVFGEVASLEENYRKARAVMMEIAIPQYLPVTDIGIKAAEPLLCFHAKTIDGVFRMYPYLEGNPAQDARGAALRAAGVGFGSVQRALARIDAATLARGTAFYHNPERRMEELTDGILERRVDPERLAAAANELSFVQESVRCVFDLQQEIEQGGFPLRTVHGDTKLGNLLLDETGTRAVGMLDFDTVMPGYLVYEFGDAARSILARGDETEALRPFAAGYFSAMQEFLTEEELVFLTDGIIGVTFELGIRYLTDYLTGDRYFGAASLQENLLRARKQFALVKRLREERTAIQKLLCEVFGNPRKEY